MAAVRPHPEDPEGPWTPERFEAALAPFFAEYGELLFTPEARQAHWTVIDREDSHRFRVRHTLLDPAEDHLWHLEGDIDLSPGAQVEGPLLALRQVGS